MALRPILKVADRWFAALNTTVNSSATSWVLKSSGATGLPVIDSLSEAVIHMGAEKAKVTAVATDTPSAGLDTLTVERGYGDSTGAGHTADDAVGHYLYEDVINEMADRIQMLEQFILDMKGRQNGVIRIGGDPGTGLQVTAQGSPDMTVNVSKGGVIADGHPCSLRSAATITFVAPSGDPRIDLVVIYQDGTVAAVTGTEDASPTAPSTPSGAFKLAEINHVVGETHIDDSNGGDGYITDTRTYI